MTSLLSASFGPASLALLCHRDHLDYSPWQSGRARSAAKLEKSVLNRCGVVVGFDVEGNLQDCWRPLVNPDADRLVLWTETRLSASSASARAHGPEPQLHRSRSPPDQYDLPNPDALFCRRRCAVSMLAILPRSRRVVPLSPIPFRSMGGGDDVGLWALASVPCDRRLVRVGEVDQIVEGAR